MRKLAREMPIKEAVPRAIEECIRKNILREFLMKNRAEVQRMSKIKVIDDRNRKYMKITWLGHSCFKFEQNDYTLIVDPYFDGSVPGLANMKEKANKVLCSHGHKDHAGIEMVELNEEGICPFKVEIIDAYHDDVQGQKRGNNRIHIIETEGIRIAHLGDLGCDLTQEQIAVLTEVDIMLIPVGGFYTIDAEQAKEIVLQCKPKVTIPMHYRSDKYKFGYDVMATVEDFVEIMDHVEETNISEIDMQNSIESMEVKVQVLVPQNISI